MKHIIKIVLLTFLIYAVMSCWPNKPSKVDDKIFGSYIFQFPSKELQVLSINSDSTYRQKIYKNEEGFIKKSEPLYVNKGKWSVSENSKLNFENWLSYCYLRDPDSIPPNPKYVNMSNVSWNRSAKNHNGYISIFYENGYVFMNIQDWRNEEGFDELINNNSIPPPPVRIPQNILDSIKDLDSLSRAKFVNNYDSIVKRRESN